MSAAVGGPHKSAANQKTAPSAPPLPPKGKLPNSVPVTHQNGAMPSGSAAVNGFKPPVPPKPSAAPATIAKPVSQQLSQQSRDDGKVTPAAVAAAKTEKVADGKVAATTPLERAQKLAADVQQRATLVVNAVINVFTTEGAAVARIHHETGAWPKEASCFRMSDVNTGKFVEAGYRCEKLLNEAKEILKAPLSVAETRAFPHVLKAAVDKLQDISAAVGSLAKAEPNVSLNNSQIVKAQVVRIIKKHPFS